MSQRARDSTRHDIRKLRHIMGVQLRGLDWRAPNPSGKERVHPNVLDLTIFIQEMLLIFCDDYHSSLVKSDWQAVVH